MKKRLLKLISLTTLTAFVVMLSIQASNMGILGMHYNEKYNVSFEIYSFNKTDTGYEFFARVWRDGSQVGYGIEHDVDIERFEMPTLELDSLAHTMRVSGAPSNRIAYGKIGNTTSTFNPNTGTGTAPIDGDGGVGTVQNDAFATIIARNGDDHDDTGLTRNAVALKASATTDQFENYKYSLYGVPSGGLPDTDDIISAVFSVYVNSKVTNLGSDDMVVVAGGTPADGSDLANTDFNPSGRGSTLFATGKDISSLTNNAYADYSLNASGIAHISKTADTWFAITTQSVVDGSFGGTWSSGADTSVNVNMADNGSNIPKLVVEHAEASTGNPGAVMMMNMVAMKFKPEEPLTLS